MIRKFSKLVKVRAKFVCTSHWWCAKCHKNYYGTNPPSYSDGCYHAWDPRN